MENKNLKKDHSELVKAVLGNQDVQMLEYKFDCENIKCISWVVTAQACYNSHVQLIDACTNEILGSATKGRTTTGDYRFLQQGYFFYDQKTLVIKVWSDDSIHAGYNLKGYTTSSNILDQKGNKVGVIYSICIEDQDDDDFNDICINICGWTNAR